MTFHPGQLLTIRASAFAWVDPLRSDATDRVYRGDVVLVLSVTAVNMNLSYRWVTFLSRGTVLMKGMTALECVANDVG